MLETVNLHAVANRAVGGFSGGMKQRLGIAQALINQPDLVIVDEPTAGLDPEERVRFRHVLSDAAFGKLVILSTHIVSDIESVADTIAIMKDGRLVALATPEALLRRAAGHVWEVVDAVRRFRQAAIDDDDLERRAEERRRLRARGGAGDAGGGCVSRGPDARGCVPLHPQLRAGIRPRKDRRRERAASGASSPPSRRISSSVSAGSRRSWCSWS